MPYVFGNDGWKVNTTHGDAASAGYVQIKTLFEPVDGVLTASMVTSDAMSQTRQSYSNATITYWNATGAFNTQGQKWFAANPAAVQSGGVQNRATPRGALGFYGHHVTEFEFMYTGNGKLEVIVQAVKDTAGYDISVWVERGGKMRRLSNRPKGEWTTISADGIRYRNIELSEHYHGRIRVHVANAIFVGIGHEASTILKAAPDRYVLITDGDSYMDGQYAQNADGTTGFFSSGLNDFLFEKTGFVTARRAQGGTGFFNNGEGTATTDATSFLNTSRIGSASRKAWMASDFAAKPLIYMINGTWNDGASSGGQAPMYARAKVVYQEARATDPYCTIVHVLCEPYWGDGGGGFGAAGTATGPPTVGNVHHLNVLGQIQAAAEVPNTFTINPFGPDNPWWTGKGDSTTAATTDATSQQARLTGADHIHGNYDGYEHYAARITRELGDMRVYAARARRQV